MSKEEMSSDGADFETPSSRVTASYLKDMVTKTVQMEVDRCNSLRRMSGTLLTGSSIVCVALLTASRPLFSFFSRDSSLQQVLLCLYIIVIGLLLAAIALAVASQLRFGYQALPSPADIKNAVGDAPLLEIGAAVSVADSMEPAWQGLSRRNNIMRGLLTASAVCVLSAICITAAGAVLLLPPVFGMLNCCVRE